MPDLLFELGTEEIPAGYIRAAIASLKQRAESRLKEEGLQFRSVVATATPRRLVVAISELPVAQAAREEEVSGPPERAAFKDGAPTKAALGFAKKQGVEVDALYLKDTAKGRYVHAKRRIEGRAIGEILCEILPGIVGGLTWPKSMRWPQADANGASGKEESGTGTGTDTKKKNKKKKKKKSHRKTFARPVRRLMCILGNQVLPVQLFGLTATRMTTGHPYLAGDREIALERADYPAYRALLKGHFVVADRNERRALIQKGLEDLYERHGAKLHHDELVEEVTDLVEHPEVLEGTFDERYLALPPEVIDAAMTEHQRYFPIYRGEGELAPSFAFVADRTARTAGQIIEGNERVLAARLEDAMFYLAEDLKSPLAEREDAQRGITHHEKLGTTLDRTRRIERLTGALSEALGHGSDDKAAAARAAALCKADLTTDLVAEFPKLQGAIGAEYARRQGEGEAVCRAIREHYQPRFAGDALPESAAGLAVALADKLDHLACFFAAGFEPSGSADPFALRRQALGVVRIVAERGLSLGVDVAVREAARGVPEGLMEEDAIVQTLGVFLGERFAALLKDKGLRYDLALAVLAAKPLDDFLDVQRRADALTALSKQESFGALVELVERTYNISKSLDDPEKGLERRAVRADLLEAGEEKTLHAAWEGAREAYAAKVEAKAYEDAAAVYLEALKGPVHAFFDKVFVNVDDQDVRLNRLSLCRDLHDAFARRIADLTKVVIEGAA